MKVSEVLAQRNRGSDVDYSPNIYHLWGIYPDMTATETYAVGVSPQILMKGLVAIEGPGPRVLTTFGITGAYPVALLYHGMAGSYAQFDLIPQYKLLTDVWVHYPMVPPVLEPVKCPIKLYRKLKTGRRKEGRLTMRFYYCYLENLVKPLKPDDWIFRELISRAEKRL